MNSGLVPKDVLKKSYDGEAEKIPVFSAKMSELCKFVWAGSLALLFSLLVGSQTDPGKAFYSQNRYLVIGAAVCGSIALVLEYFQYTAAYMHTVKLVSWIEEEVSNSRPITFETFNERTKSALSALNEVLFICKNIIAFASAVLIAVSVFRFALD